MTIVHVDLRKPAADGTDVPDAKGGYLECSPTARRKVDQHLTLPAAFNQSLVDGKATLDLAATVDGTWAWKITERAVTGATRRLVAVPAGDPVNYADLLEVDPETLDPTVPPIPVYKQLIDQAQAKADAAVPSAELPGLLADELDRDGSPANVVFTAKIAALKQWAKDVDTIVTGSVTVDGNDLVTSAIVEWPDGKPGVLTIDSRQALTNAVLTYHVTHVDGATTQTFTQPGITRNANGAATNVPQIVVS